LYLTNITYFQMTGTPLRPGDCCYGSGGRNYSSGHLCNNKSFMTMDNISIMCHYLRYVAS